MTLELKDGGIIAPRDVFEVLDTVEEYTGTDVRQYLEDYLGCDTPEVQSMEEHTVELLEAIDYIAFSIGCKLDGKKLNKEELQFEVENIRKLIRRATDGKKAI